MMGDADMENQKEMMVSIICNAYNHEPFIRDALEGFVTQKTDFPFEVLIHDDASTDHTADIIREYEKKYPDIIRPIYQTENQYSQHKSIGRIFQFPRVKGKYVALCEGDDYWIDPEKLQKQVDLLEKHADVDICAHASKTIDANTGEYLRSNKKADKVKIISTEEVISGGGGFVATASLVYRSSLLNDIPEFRKMIGIDYTTQVHGALRGGMLYLPDIMSVYRANVSNSATQGLKQNLKRKIALKDKVYKMFKQMDLDTNGKYHRIIRKLKVENRVRRYILTLESFIKR